MGGGGNGEAIQGKDSWELVGRQFSRSGLLGPSCAPSGLPRFSCPSPIPFPLTCLSSSINPLTPLRLF